MSDESIRYIPAFYRVLAPLKLANFLSERLQLMAGTMVLLYKLQVLQAVRFCHCLCAHCVRPMSNVIVLND